MAISAMLHHAHAAASDPVLAFAALEIHAALGMGKVERNSSASMSGLTMF